MSLTFLGAAGLGAAGLKRGLNGRILLTADTAQGVAVRVSGVQERHLLRAAGVLRTVTQALPGRVLQERNEQAYLV